MICAKHDRSDFSNEKCPSCVWEEEQLDFWVDLQRELAIKPSSAFDRDRLEPHVQQAEYIPHGPVAPAIACCSGSWKRLGGGFRISKLRMWH